MKELFEKKWFWKKNQQATKHEKFRSGKVTERVDIFWWSKSLCPCWRLWCSSPCELMPILPPVRDRAHNLLINSSSSSSGGGGGGGGGGGSSSINVYSVCTAKVWVEIHIKFRDHLYMTCCPLSKFWWFASFIFTRIRICKWSNCKIKCDFNLKFNGIVVFFDPEVQR